MRAWIAFVILITVILSIQYLPAAFGSGCPKNTYGAGEKTVKYFSSPLCVACWMQKPIIEKVAADANIKFEEYDADFCQQAAAPNYVKGVPAFIYEDKMSYGLHDEDALRKVIE